MSDKNPSELMRDFHESFRMLGSLKSGAYLREIIMEAIKIRDDLYTSGSFKGFEIYKELMDEKIDCLKKLSKKSSLNIEETIEFYILFDDILNMKDEINSEWK